MRIAFNTSPFQVEDADEAFLGKAFYKLAEIHPEHQFLFLSSDNEQLIHLPSNGTLIPVLGKVSNALSIKWWLDVKVPLALKKHKADVLVTLNGCSLTTSIPQVLVVDDLSFLHYPKFISKQKLFFLKKYTPKFLRKAKVVATVSEFMSKEIENDFKIQGDKLINVGGFCNAGSRLVDWEEREAIKERYADGFEYFVFVGGLHPKQNLLNLLKAFSQFKIRQRSSMKLVVVGQVDDRYADTLDKLKTYKFKDEVKMVGKLLQEEYDKVIASAYALIFPGFYEGFATPVLEAMQCEVPVITSNNSSMLEIGGDAVLLADPKDPADIAEQLKLIFKDESLRSQMIEKGKVQAAKYSCDKTVSLMWQAIEQAVSK